ncbi:hypothetical protein GCM10011608_02630 [Micromonospora sonchi]|uniref:DUF2510 domain-containing protein n=1 Tax=Micromonospora sonchi TaxID=1763543 RepID=A0A917TFN2_9ACTN|nr:DUF2510 domain-containing protein [Micromonospora sonchi]GGM21455.1 hypothetical protein GCM10011608_02630 [Micromonospora sonchi]
MRPGWYPDPSGRYPLRWFDGTLWTPQVLDGWQRPVVDPLPPAAEAASPPAPAPTPPATDVRAETEDAGPTTPGPPPMAVPPADQGRLVFWMAWRILLLVVALGLLFAGFVVLPWGHIIRFGPPPVTVHYFEFAGWIDVADLPASGWQRAYAQGLGLVHAFVAFVATAATIAVSRPGRHAPWAGFLQLLLFASWIAAHFGTPYADLKGVHPGGGGMAVIFAFFAFFIACPSFNTEPTPAPPARSES